MILPIKRIPEGHSVLSQTVEMSEEQQRWLKAKSLECRAEIDRIRSLLHVQLFYSGSVRIECARCCSPFDYPVQGDFRVMCVHASDAGKDGEFSRQEIDFVFDDSTDEIDLTPLIYEEVMVSLPMKPLCSEQCAGIAHKSNVAKNAKTAENDETIDPRWEALKKLRKQEWS
jgi:uncharacterized protein